MSYPKHDDELPAGWVDLKTVATVLGVSYMTASRRVKAGDIPAIQLDGPGSSIRIKERDLTEYVKTRKVHICVCTHGEI